MTDKEQRIPLIKSTKDGKLIEGDFDAVIIVAIEASSAYIPVTSPCHKYLKFIEDVKEHDEYLEKEGGLILLPAEHKNRRLIYSPVGRVNRDFDDIRRFRDAALRGIKRAMKAGSVSPIIGIPFANSHSITYPLYDVAIVLGAFEAIYTPLEIREASKLQKLKQLSFFNFTSEQREKDVYRLAEAIERGRNVARDIGGSDPERMSAIQVAKYVEETFSGSIVKVEVISDKVEINREFPCLGIVDRGSIDRHSARVIFLTYDPPTDVNSPIDTTVVLVGKGVTYDTGGADIKAGGIMAGMHRDKCGAAAVAGFFKTLDLLRPKGIRVLGAMPMVRNAIGPDSYVADELMVSRSGARVRIGNTDAEGRMAMVDMLCYFKEKLIKENHPNPQIFTMATLTGHACLAAGEFSIIMDNGPARQLQQSRRIQEAGDKIGDIFEVSNIRREDYEFNLGKSEYEDYLQCNNLPSSRTPRGHQIPAAFLLQVSGLDKHGIDSTHPLPFSHIDIAASSGPFPGLPSGSPIPALAVHYLLSR